MAGRCEPRRRAGGINSANLGYILGQSSNLGLEPFRSAEDYRGHDDGAQQTPIAYERARLSDFRSRHFGLLTGRVALHAFGSLAQDFGNLLIQLTGLLIGLDGGG